MTHPIATRGAIARTALSVLMLVTLLWGGCLSCSQYFMLHGMFHGAAGSCCDPMDGCKDKHPSHEAPQGCNIQTVIVSQAESLDHSHQLTLVASLPPADVTVIRAIRISTTLRAADAPGVSPPNLTLLFSSFRI